MSRAEVQASQCSGKEAFTDMKVARKVAKRRRRYRDMGGGAYRCRFCRSIHIGRAFMGKIKRPRFVEEVEA